MMTIPSSEKNMIKFELDLDYKKVIDYGPMFVNPKYVGNKLQYQMLNELDKYSIDKNYNFVVATIHPDNIYSINNFIKDNSCIFFNLTTNEKINADKDKIFLDRKNNMQYYSRLTVNFLDLPNYPLVYTLSDKIINLYGKTLVRG